MSAKAVNLIALQKWAAKYSDPIRFKRGDRLELTGRASFWAGHRWEWAVGPDGRQGWSPSDSFERTNEKVVAAIDYSAQELSCDPGDLLVGQFESHGWYWCTNDQGRAGWLPSDVVEIR